MKLAGVTMIEHLANVEASTTVAENMTKILDAKYCKINLQTDVVDQCNTLSTGNKKKILRVLQKHKALFNCTLGMWKNSQYNIELQDSAKLHHSRQYTVPKAYKVTLCTEVEHICCIGVLHK
eukprot:15333574-Ditylum_brightwellii.AAC.1